MKTTGAIFGRSAGMVLAGDLDATRGWRQMLWLPLIQVFQLIPAKGSGGSARQTSETRTSFSALELYGKNSRLARLPKIWSTLSFLPSACLDFHDTLKLDFPR